MHCARCPRAGRTDRAGARRQKTAQASCVSAASDTRSSGGSENTLLQAFFQREGPRSLYIIAVPDTRGAQAPARRENRGSPSAAPRTRARDLAAFPRRSEIPFYPLLPRRERGAADVAAAVFVGKIYALRQMVRVLNGGPQVGAAAVMPSTRPPAVRSVSPSFFAPAT